MKFKDISEVCSRLFKLYKTREEFIEMLRFNSALISNYYLEPLYKELDYVNQGRIYDDSSEITNEFSKFHNSTFPYLKEDERISLLRNDIVEFDNLLEIPEAGKPQKEITGKLKKIRNNMVSTETQFGNLKIEFNSYLSENI